MPSPVPKHVKCRAQSAHLCLPSLELLPTFCVHSQKVELLQVTATAWLPSAEAKNCAHSRLHPLEQCSRTRAATSLLVVIPFQRRRNILHGFLPRIGILAEQVSLICLKHLVALRKNGDLDRVGM